QGQTSLPTLKTQTGCVFYTYETPEIKKKFKKIKINLKNLFRLSSFNRFFTSYSYYIDINCCLGKLK
ncbi:MAG: hypothetical protein RR396_06155, partial [Clostridiales bacterium]